MSHRIFEANRLNHGDDFLPKPLSGKERNDKDKPNQPSQTGLHTSVDGECNWLGKNPLGDDVNIIHPTKQHSDHRITNAADPTVQTTNTSCLHYDESMFDSSFETKGIIGGSISDPNSPVKSLKCPNNTDPPPLIAEAEGGLFFTGNLPSPPMADTSPKQEQGSIESSSTVSLFYFTAESSLSSMEDYADDATNVKDSEARILQALAADHAMDYLGDIEDLEFLLDSSFDLDSSIVDRCFRFRSGSLSFSLPTTSIDESYFSLTTSEGNENKDERDASAFLGVPPPIPYRHKPIESYFRCNGKTEEAPRCSTSTGQQNNECLVLTSAHTGSKSKKGGTLMALITLVRRLQRYILNNNSPWYEDKLRAISIRTRLQSQSVNANGTAISKIELLRRCFYPRKDVIKWL